MKLFITTSLCLLATVHCFSQSRTAPKQQIPVLGTRVSLTPPDGFISSSQFPGFWQESTNCSILVTEFPASFNEASSGLSNPSALSKRGMVLIEKQQVKVSGHAGILAQVMQNISGTEYLKWLLVLGDEKESVLITAAFPKGLERQLSEKMKVSVLTAKWDKEKNIAPTEGLNFSIAEIGELRIAKRMANMLLYSKNGVFPSKDIDDPFLVVGQSLATVDIGDPEEFAKRRVLKTAEVTDVEIESSNRVTIGTLDGYEIVAIAKDKESGGPMAIYQVMLFEQQGYFLIQGLVSSKNRQPFLKVFKEMARTFRRK
jgi:hypothetical protein